MRPTGGGITSTIDLYVNGVFRQALSVNSLQNYCYEGTNYNGQADKNPADGNPRGFWNDTHAFHHGCAGRSGRHDHASERCSEYARRFITSMSSIWKILPRRLTQPANSLSISVMARCRIISAWITLTAINNCFSRRPIAGEKRMDSAGHFLFQRHQRRTQRLGNNNPGCRAVV